MHSINLQPGMYLFHMSPIGAAQPNPFCQDLNQKANQALQSLLQQISTLASEEEQAFSFEEGTNTLHLTCSDGMDSDEEHFTMQLLGHSTSDKLIDLINSEEAKTPFTTFFAKSEGRVVSFSSAEAAYGIMTLQSSWLRQKVCAK